MENLIINEAQYEQFFSGVVQVAENCNYNVIRNFVLERQNLDIQGLLGSSLYVDVITNLDADKYDHLLNGGTYTGCDNTLKMHSGLRRVLTHYAYASYVYRKSFVDVPFGVVIKQSQDSIPVPTNELRNLHDEHRDIAFRYWKQVADYLCASREVLTLWKGDCICGACNKNGGKPTGAESNAKTRIKIIRK